MGEGYTYTVFHKDVLKKVLLFMIVKKLVLKIYSTKHAEVKTQCSKLVFYPSVYHKQMASLHHHYDLKQFL